MPHDRPRRGEIQLADLIRALDALAPVDDAQRDAIAASLGFGLDATYREPERPTPAAFDRSRRPLPAQGTQQRHLPAPVRAPPPPPTRVSLPDTVLGATIERGPKSPPEAATLAFLDEDGRAMPPPVAALPREELFPPTAARATLAAMLRIRREGDAPDASALIRKVIRGLPPRRLPRLPAATLAHGCQLLLDYGEDMTPWFDDLDGLGRRLADVVGESALAVFAFDDDPRSATTWIDDDRRQWTAERGRPVLVATGFSIRGHKPPREAGMGWNAFVAACRAAGCPLVLLTPWPRTCWPDWLGRYPSIVHWNPATTAAMVRRLFGIGHETGE